MHRLRLRNYAARSNKNQKDRGSPKIIIRILIREFAPPPASHPFSARRSKIRWKLSEKGKASQDIANEPPPSGQNEIEQVNQRAKTNSDIGKNNKFRQELSDISTDNSHRGLQKAVGNTQRPNRTILPRDWHTSIRLNSQRKMQTPSPTEKRSSSPTSRLSLGNPYKSLFQRAFRETIEVAKITKKLNWKRYPGCQ